MNLDFLKKAVDLSKESLEQGKFPAGALLAKGKNIVATETSSAYPHQHLHAETKIIDKTMADINQQLSDYKLYTSLSPCLMCLGKIYWSGIKKVYFVLDRSNTNLELAYEGRYDFESLISNLNRKIEFIQDTTYFEYALKIYRKWELKMLPVR